MLIQLNSEQWQFMRNKLVNSGELASLPVLEPKLIEFPMPRHSIRRKRAGGKK